MAFCILFGVILFSKISIAGLSNFTWWKTNSHMISWNRWKFSVYRLGTPVSFQRVWEGCLFSFWLPRPVTVYLYMFQYYWLFQCFTQYFINDIQQTDAPVVGAHLFVAVIIGRMAVTFHSVVIVSSVHINFIRLCDLSNRVSAWWPIRLLRVLEVVLEFDYRVVVSSSIIAFIFYESVTNFFLQTVINLSYYFLQCI